MSFDSNSLQSLCLEVNITKDTIKEAERLCNAYIRKHSVSQPLYLYIASTIAAANMTRSIPQNFYINVFKNICSSEEFIDFYKNFLKASELSNVLECEEIIESYSFSWRLYKKFIEKWAQLEIEEKQGHSGVGMQLRDVSWVLISLKRLICPSNDLVQCAHLMLGVLNFVLFHLPSTVSFSVSKDPFEFLVKIFNGNPEQAAEAAYDVENFVRDLKENEILRSNSGETMNFDGIFSASHYVYNFNKLAEYYSRSLKEFSINEIEFIKKAQPRTPIKNSRHRKPNAELKSKRIISWENEVSEADIKTKLGEVPVAASPSQNSFTPMSSAMELNNWVREVVKKTSLSQIPILLQEYNSLSNFSIYAKIEAYRNKLSSVLIEKENLPSMLQEYSNTKSKTESILKMYVYSIHGMIKNEQKRQGNLSILYNNENFHQATFGCCVESIVFCYGISFDFHQVLDIADVSVFEFWKLITTFVQFDSKIPVALKKHFKDVESFIMNEYAWNEKSPIRLMLAQYVLECKSSSGNPIFSIFFKRLLSHVAQKLIEITEQLEILEEVKERIWELVKLCITEHIDLFQNRSLDTIILCSVYAVCKIFKPVSFKTLIESFSVLHPTKESAFKHIPGAGDIIKFYNHFFIPCFKDFLSQGLDTVKNLFQSPLRASLPVTSPSKSPGFCSPKTPYLTPRTRKLWASSETAHTIIPKKGRLISFDDEPQLPKIEEDSPIR
jgi:Retinoblastoma-associated protein A domain/Retinoblastoma-associated protein B domain